MEAVICQFLNILSHAFGGICIKFLFTAVLYKADLYPALHAFLILLLSRCAEDVFMFLCQSAGYIIIQGIIEDHDIFRAAPILLQNTYFGLFGCDFALVDDAQHQFTFATPKSVNTLLWVSHDGE